MTLRIIDNKSVDLTNSEFELYNAIAQSYDTTRFKGADLFKGLFETNDEGMIIFLRPPNHTHASMEVYLFLVQVLINQQLRITVTNHDNISKSLQEQFAEKIKVLDQKINKLDEFLAKNNQ